ncbi:hypothetical protein KFK09_003051 [Dendrobium nobile]|uniref:Uncharacterized protein n=1 Tax=Dendrobium nobile TaxID=94219 RepID=A0A8T3C812_DENNO|nr:hypothetical protein KFK09_003051 [Dendrobium nobile]
MAVISNTYWLDFFEVIFFVLGTSCWMLLAGVWLFCSITSTTPIRSTSALVGSLLDGWIAEKKFLERLGAAICMAGFYN